MQPPLSYKESRGILSHRKYEEEGEKYLQSSFPISGKALTAHVEMTLKRDFDDNWNPYFLKVIVPGKISKILVQPPAIVRVRKNVFDRIFKWNP